MITVSKEDYLKAILEAESEGATVISATLAHWLSVSAPAVTMALRRLKKDGLVAVRANGRVELTAAGRKIAHRTMVRHHLIERMLAEVFGMEWFRVHDEAERLEHAVSAEFESKLRRERSASTRARSCARSMSSCVMMTRASAFGLENRFILPACAPSPRQPC